LGESSAEIATQIEELWRRKLQEADINKKVPFIYLANDLIQRSKIKALKYKEKYK
jgi:hypothetical protein